MKLFKIKVSLYLLPIFFYVLALSPNIAGDRIGLVLVSVYFLLIPGANYLSERLRKLRNSNIHFNYSIKDAIALLVLLAALYVGWGISWQYLIMQLLYVIFIVVKDTKEGIDTVGVSWYLRCAVFGLIFYSLIFLGLNQYSFSILFSLANIVPTLLVGIIIITTFYINKVNEGADGETGKVLLYIFTQALAFSIYFYIVTELKYAAYFVITLAIPVLVIFWNKSKKDKNSNGTNSSALTTTLWLLPVLQTLFFLYYFLETTQVLQAVSGGY